MKNIKVLGTGCANCKTTVRLIDEIAKENGVEIQLEKVEEIRASWLMAFWRHPALSLMAKWCIRGEFPRKKKSRNGLLLNK